MKSFQDPDGIFKSLQSVMRNPKLTEESLRAAVEEILSRTNENFRAYFMSTWMQEPEKWAAYKRDGNPYARNTTSLSESFHNLLKTIFMERRKKTGVDRLLLILTEEMHNDFYEPIRLRFAMGKSAHAALKISHKRPS